MRGISFKLVRVFLDLCEAGNYWELLGSLRAFTCDLIRFILLSLLSMLLKLNVAFKYQV